MIRPLLLTTMLLLIPGITWSSEVFRCQGPDGVIFSDQPCGKDATRVNVIDNRIGGRLNQNLPEPEPEPETSDVPDDVPDEEKQATVQDSGTCRFINSTDLRRYIVREQVVQGMTRDNVRRAFGNPPETYTTPQEVWIYQTRYYGALYELTYVYFRDGCVERVEYRKP